MAFSASASSQFRYRGFALSDGRPTLAATTAYEHRSGLYASVTGTAAFTRNDGLQFLGHQAYAGYARRTGSGLSVDLGVAHTDIIEEFAPKESFRYAELYAGVSKSGVGAHLYYSPNYGGEGVDTLYASLDGGAQIRPSLRWFAHAGVLCALNATPANEIHGTHFDGAAGLALRLKPVELQLSFSHVAPRADYPAAGTHSRSALTASATVFF